ncbi:hypothetical protein F2Q70_00023117 [Brassica cretica]|uniref:Uncharacterized protein n=1 Tax=Brassica cretica TaxID=69181 RepID=A0A8S9GKF9_BRACR|nr:hypothetical protein F2Q70_00023117 [Brassica cretica]
MKGDEKWKSPSRDESGPGKVPTATATRPSEPHLFGRCRNQRHKPCSREEKHLERQARPRGSQAKTLLLGTDKISFTAKEQEKVLTPHHGALVISLTVANCLVKKILVDNGCSGNIIFQAAYKDLGLEEGALTRRITPLIGFSGDVKQTIGESKPPARHTEEPVVEEIDEVPLTERDQTRHLQIGSKLTKGLRRRLIDFLRSNSESGIEFLQTPGKTPASGSPLEGTPVPRIPAMEFSGFGLRIDPSPGKWKTSDKENLPYFRIWKSLTYCNRLRPAIGRLHKGNLNPKARHRHFKA